MTRLMPTIITRSHHFFTSAQRILGEERLATVWKKSVSQVYRWGADPARCDDPSRNPIDLLKVLFDDLQEVGRDDVVEGALRILAESHGYQVGPREIRSDKNSATRFPGPGRSSPPISKCCPDGHCRECGFDCSFSFAS